MSRANKKSFFYNFNRRRAINIAMVVSLPISLVGAVLGSIRLHIYAGIVFLGFLGNHIYGKKTII